MVVNDIIHVVYYPLSDWIVNLTIRVKFDIIRQYEFEDGRSQVWHELHDVYS